MKKWFVYMLRCSGNSLYTGVTTDLDRRFKEHTEGKVGAKYTRANKPTELVYAKRCKDRSAAQIEEARIKKLTRAEKEIFIVSGRKAPTTRSRSKTP